MTRIFRLLSLGFALAVLLGVLLLPLAPARADAGRWLDSPSYAELSGAIASLRPTAGAPGKSLSPDQQKRYDDLLALQAAIARSDDRSQVDNRSSHSIGVYTRYKKAPANSPAEFVVLAPGHETDDDFDLIGLYLPAGVALEWGEDHGVGAAGAPRVARVLEGQRLRVSDPAPVEPAAEATPAPAYRLDLPSFAVVGSSDQVAELPALSQDELDAHPETAPVD
ncbi:hypothetical protein NZK33_17445 [Cyanobium sp. FGCU-6]|nr:hypothetical protein [Cyanobium sp. FGCU6]